MKREEIEQAMKEAFIASLQDFSKHHPATWAALCRKANNNPAQFIWDQLQQDKDYQALLNQTGGEIKAAQILQIAMSAIFRFVPLLLGTIT